MRDLAVLLLHLLAMLARLASPGGDRAVVAESVLVKQQADPDRTGVRQTESALALMGAAQSTVSQHRRLRTDRGG